jgi:hypothetical protein
MTDPNITAEPPLSQFQKYGGPGFILLTTAVVLAVAWWLWTFGGVRGQGAALTLAGGAAAHLLKETQEMLKFWCVRRELAAAPPAVPGEQKSMPPPK